VFPTNTTQEQVYNTCAKQIVKGMDDDLKCPCCVLMYMLPLGHMSQQHHISLHCYADDYKLFLSIKPSEYNELAALQRLIGDVRDWMSQTFCS